MAEEREFMGGRKSKMWTYLILMAVLLVVAVVVNFTVNNPAMAKHGVGAIFGLPSWALALLVFVIGAGIFWVGLRLETDWPEALGAFMIAGSVWAAEVMIGWSRFEFGLFILPYVIPLVVFVVLLMYGMKRSA